MTELRRRMLEDLQLAVFAPKTQKSYVDAVQRLPSNITDLGSLVTNK